jgi:hypothetical protein
MPKMTAIEALQWSQVVFQLITIGATTYSTVRQSMADAGFEVDDARLVALEAEYGRRLERAKAAAEGRE